MGENMSETRTINNSTVTHLETLQFASGGLFDFEPVDGMVHLVRGVAGHGTPGPSLCGIDRFAPGSAGWSVGGGVDGPGIKTDPCAGCVAVARADFGGLPVHGMAGLANPIREALAGTGVAAR